MFFDLGPTLFVAVGCLAAAVDCSRLRRHPGRTIPYDRPFAAPDEPSIAPLESDYKISPMDKLTIKVFKSEDLSGDYDVDLTGKISMPLIGEMEAANLTTAELDQKISEKLGEKYLEHPDVSVGDQIIDGARGDGRWRGEGRRDPIPSPAR